MSETGRKILIAAGLVVFFVILGIIYVFIANSKPDNDVTLTGNTAGNINNGGLFCEMGDKVYFANSTDGGSLYSMNSDETGFKKITNVSVSSLNVDNDRIYYVMKGGNGGSGLGYIRKSAGLYSIRHNGSDSICYTMDAVGLASLSGNHILYQHYRNNKGTDLDKIRIDKKDNVTIASNMVSPASVANGSLYYSGEGRDHYLYMMDVVTGASMCIYEHNMYNPVYQNGNVYYMDLEGNYNLRKYNISTGEDVLLTDAAIDCFNVYDNVVVYQTASASSSPALYRMDTDGLGVEMIAEGIYCDINITSHYIYYREFNLEGVTYHQSLYGAIAPSPFLPFE